MGGHLVTGHVDGVGRVCSRDFAGGTLYVGVEAPPEMAPLIASQGSVAVAGVSLTVARVTGAVLVVALIPHTRAVTTLDKVSVGARVNLEADLIARYVQRLMSFGASSPPASLTSEFLKDKVFL